MLFVMSGDESLGYWYRKTRHSSSRLRNNDNEIPDEEGLEVSLGEKSSGHIYLETSNSSSSNNGGRGRRYFDTSHYSFRNRR